MQKMCLLILVSALFAGSALAQCNMASLHGTYGYVGFGTVAAKPSGLPTGNWSSVGILNFNGRGGLVITDTARVEGLTLWSDRAFPSTYTVDHNCVATFTITEFAAAGIPGPHFKVVIVDNRAKIVGISLLPGVTVNFVSTTRI